MPKGCGGALIAADTVLFAAHCGRTMGHQLSIGAYKSGSTDEGAEDRFCEEWITDPMHSEGAFLDNDFALCKLNMPVALGGNTITLELNEDDSVPIVADELLVMGMGRTSAYGGPGSEFLRAATVPYLSNEDCNELNPNPNITTVTDNMLCAGYPLGGDGSCFGDSGGPIVKRTRRNGSIVDVHIGVVSWGFYGSRCDKGPGVYARTSKRVDWIKNTMCNDFRSIAPFCNNALSAPLPSTIVECGDGEEAVSIQVTTDAAGFETVWTILNTDYEIMMQRRYLFNQYENNHTLCLKSDERYIFEIIDKYSRNGMCAGGKCGSYSLSVNDEVLVSGDGNFGWYMNELFSIGDPPTFEPTALYTAYPTHQPSTQPSSPPSSQPTLRSSTQPSSRPSSQPSSGPLTQPSLQPSSQPTRFFEGFDALPTCGPGNDNLRYQMILKTDHFGNETTVATHSFNEDYTELDQIVFRKEGFASNTLYTLPSEDNYFCLEQNRCYYFEISDSSGDGMKWFEENGLDTGTSGYFEGRLGGKLHNAFRGNGDFGYTDNKIFCTGSVCKNKGKFEITRKKKNCRKYVKGGRNVLEKRCARKWKGAPVYDWCPESCGKKAGIGACAWWKDKKKEMKALAMASIAASEASDPLIKKTKAMKKQMEV